MQVHFQGHGNKKIACDSWLCYIIGGGEPCSCVDNGLIM